MKHHSLIFLTGFSGSGKSTIGPLLANSLGYDFIDLDQAIEAITGKSVSRIFAEEGESYFRKLELDTLKTVTNREELIVSLGGGALESNECYTLIKEKGTPVYLKSGSGTLTKRLCHKTDRPLLKSEQGGKLSNGEIEQKIRELLARREPRYNSATITVQTDTGRIGSTVEELTRKINRYVRKTTGNSRAK